LIGKTLLDIIAVNREDLQLSSNTALNILSMIHRNFPDIADEECVLSLTLNDSIARMVFHADLKKAISISRDVVKKFSQSPYHYFVARHLGVIGRCLALSGRHAEAEETLKQALKEGERLTLSSQSFCHMADVLHDLAMNNDMARGDAAQSIEYLEKAIQMLNGTSYELRKGVCLMGIGNIKYNNGKVQSALEYYLMASLIFDEQSNFSNLASVDSNIGLCYTDLDMADLAGVYLNRSLLLRRKIGNSDEIAISYYNLSRLYERNGNIDQAIVSLVSCQEYCAGSVNKKLYYLTQEGLDKLAGLKVERLQSVPYSNERQVIQTL
jgi:tetratricopeptide (TPR) repeat protein